jgi:hypothetical protein
MAGPDSTYSLPSTWLGVRGAVAIGLAGGEAAGSCAAGRQPARCCEDDGSTGCTNSATPPEEPWLVGVSAGVGEVVAAAAEVPFTIRSG